MTFSAYQKVAETLRHARHPLLVLLKDVDADALGSTMAMAHAMEEQGSTPVLFCLGEIPESLQFLLQPRIPLVQDFSKINRSTIDAITVVDAGHLGRTGIEEELKALRDSGVPLLNIDHHQMAAPFGSTNLVDTEASATTVLVYDVLKLGGWNITRDVATAILAGIIADTGNFSNGGTTIRALEIAAHCYAKGAENRRIIQALYHSKPFDALKLWGDILARLTKNEKLGIVTTVILQEDFSNHQIDDESTEGLANFLNGIRDMRAALILKELPNGEVRGSFRTTRDDVNVGRLAQMLGGGGHRKAAGFTISGRIVRDGKGWRVI
ncbi:MAG: bifunctional oligoribonuclease/PAP phosphatase NrnA [Patescibacteria group bacterium]|jgi:phosphoesterase RecJ-like protein